MQALQQVNVSIQVLQETKLTEGIHALYSAGYKVWVKEAERWHQRGVIAECQEEAEFQE